MAKRDPQPYERSSLKLHWYEIIWNNLLGGIAWGIGATVGLAVFFYLLTMLAKNVDLVPIVGSFASEVIDFILATNPRVGQDK
jgi:hypothetical protein